jgi:geranylgeranyl pyrophosphate synthase
VAEAFESNHPSNEKIHEAIEAIGQGTAIQQAKSLSKTYAERAYKVIPRLPPSLYRNGLKTLVQLIIERDF